MKVLNFFLVFSFCCSFLMAQEESDLSVKTRQIAEELAQFKESDYIKKRLEMKSEYFRSMMNTADKVIAAGQQKNFFRRWVDLWFLNIYPGSLLEVGSEYGLFWVNEQTLPKLFGMIKDLTTKMNIAMSYIFINFDKDFFNAMACSFSTNHSMILLGFDLVSKCSDAEIEAIIAHECGHILHNHIPKRLAMIPVMMIFMILIITTAERLSSYGIEKRKQKIYAQTEATLEHSDECKENNRKYTTLLNEWGDRFRSSSSKCSRCQRGSFRQNALEPHYYEDLLFIGVMAVGFFGLGGAFIYLMPRLSRFFEKQADKAALDVLNDPQGFVDAMTLFEKSYHDKLACYTQEYSMALAKAEECEQVYPFWGRFIKKAIESYYAELSAAFKDILEGSGDSHPTPRARIEYGKKAVEVKRKTQESQTTSPV